jgi:hypothetical protein
MKTITDAINDGDFSGAIAIMGDVMPGNSDMEKALEACQEKQGALAVCVNNALAVADGN